jgi:hypothetical protein
LFLLLPLVSTKPVFKTRQVKEHIKKIGLQPSFLTGLLK